MVALMICLGLFTGCERKSSQIDIGGEIETGKPSASCQVRILLDNYIFDRDDRITLTVGFGLINPDIRGYEYQGAIIKLTIDANNFIIITNEESTEVENLYEKIFDEYSDSKFVCTIKNDRYIPNYYQTFELMLNSDEESASGSIQTSAVIHCGGDGNGQNKWLFYAFDSETVVFSTTSIEDAQKKLL